MAIDYDTSGPGLSALRSAGKSKEEESDATSREAAANLAEIEKKKQAQGAAAGGAVSLGSTLLGALIGGIVTGGNPAGIAAGAGIGGSIGGVGAAAVNPSLGSAAGAATGLASGDAAYEKLLKLMKQQEGIDTGTLPNPALEEGLPIGDIGDLK